MLIEITLPESLGTPAIKLQITRPVAGNFDPSRAMQLLSLGVGYEGKCDDAELRGDLNTVEEVVKYRRLSFDAYGKLSTLIATTIEACIKTRNGVNTNNLEFKMWFSGLKWDQRILATMAIVDVLFAELKIDSEALKNSPWGSL